MPNHIPLIPAAEHERRQRRAHSAVPQLWEILDEVMDPEIPVVSIWELGILQDVALIDDNVLVTITPTYSGCPAMDVIAEDIDTALSQSGFTRSEIVTRLAPAWSTSWISPQAQEKLRAYGIAPPGETADGRAIAVACPRCGSTDLRRISEFGSTACKALYQCRECAEPFDHFKSI